MDEVAAQESLDIQHRNEIGAQGAVIVVCAMLVAIVLGAFGFEVHQRYNHEIARAERETENARNVLVEHSARTFEAVIAALRMVAELREEVEGRGGRVDHESVHDMLRVVDAGSPVLRGVSWTDAAGNRIASSLLRDPRPLNIADQAHFKVHAEKPDVGVFVGTPMQSRFDSDRVIAVSKRVNDADGKFAGIVNALVRLDYFARFYETLDLGPKRIVGLAKRDGALIARVMQGGASEGSIADRRLITTELPRAAEGTFTSGGAATGSRDRILSYGAVPGLPLVIYAAMARDDALAQFYRELRSGASRTILVILALLGGAWLLVVLLRERDREVQAQSLLANVVTNSDDAIITSRLDGTITSWNAGAERLLGHQTRDMIGQPIHLIAPPDQRTAEVQMLARVKRGEAFVNVHAACQRKDGMQVDVAFTASPLRDAKGAIVGVSRILRDITERKRAEAKFRHLLESAPDSMIIANGWGRIVLVNAQTEKLFGYGRQELLGQPVETLLPQRPATDPSSGSRVFARRKDGTEFPAELTLNTLFTAEGMLVTTAVRDISDREQRERDLAMARDAADRANRAKSEFLSCMSHELRTPLNAVIGFGQMLELDPHDRLNTKQKEYCRHVVSSGHHLLNLVNEVLDLAQVESGKLKLSIERIAVADALMGITRTMTALAAKNDLRMDIAMAVGIPDVRADELRLRQVLINLVSNAIKYNRPGGLVSVSAQVVSGGHVRFAVTDTGLGIEPAKQQNLFQPFQRLGAEFTGIEGTGIGLAIARKLVEAMDGSIGYSTEPGSGSTFWIDLPMEAADRRQPAETPAPVIKLGPSRVVGGGHSLLYVEDNPANLELMQHLVGTLPGVEMLSATTAQLGLDLAVVHRPSVIVLDLNLPGMSGYDVLKRLKAMPETRDIPVLALTAAAMPRDVQRGLAAGFYGYLTKPIDVKAFLAAVDEVLAGSEKQRAAG